MKAFILRSAVNKHRILSPPLYCNLYNTARYEFFPNRHPREGKKKIFAKGRNFYGATNHLIPLCLFRHRLLSCEYKTRPADKMQAKKVKVLNFVLWIMMEWAEETSLGWANDDHFKCFPTSTRWWMEFWCQTLIACPPSQ